jgi:hypothetical protein
VANKGESKSATIGVAVTPTEKTDLEKLAHETDRSVSYWVGKFMRDGWAAYRGGQNDAGGESGGRGGEPHRPPIDKMPSKKLGRKKLGGKREIS